MPDTDDITALLTGPIAERMGWDLRRAGHIVINFKQFLSVKYERPAIVSELILPTFLDSGGIVSNIMRVGPEIGVGLQVAVTGGNPGAFKRVYGMAEAFEDAVILAFAKLTEGGWRPRPAEETTP